MFLSVHYVLTGTRAARHKIDRQQPRGPMILLELLTLLVEYAAHKYSKTAFWLTFSQGAKVIYVHSLQPGIPHN